MPRVYKCPTHFHSGVSLRVCWLHSACAVPCECVVHRLEMPHRGTELLTADLAEFPHPAALWAPRTQQVTVQSEAGKVLRDHPERAMSCEFTHSEALC